MNSGIRSHQREAPNAAASVTPARSASLDSLIERLRTEEPARSADSESASHPCCQQNIKVQIAQPGGAFGTFVVQPIGISTTGMDFVYAGFLHAGTQCLIRLMTISRAWRDLYGRVQSCEYLERGLHRIRVGFREQITVEEFVERSARRPLVLIVSSAADVRDLAGTIVQDADMVCTADTIKAAEHHFSQARWDVAVISAQLSDGPGAELVARLRAAGSACFFIGVVEDGAASDPASAGAFDAELAYPFEYARMVALIKDAWQQRAPAPVGGAACCFQPPLETFIKKALPEALQQATAALQAGDRAELVLHVRAIGVSAGCYGFAGLAEASKAVETALLSKSGGTELAQTFKNLLRAGRRIVAH